MSIHFLFYPLNKIPFSLFFIMRERLAQAIFSGTLLAGGLASGTSFYNNKRTIVSSEKMQIEVIQSNERINIEVMKSNEADRLLNLESLEIEKFKLGLPCKYNNMTITNPMSTSSRSGSPALLGPRTKEEIIVKNVQENVSTNSMDFSPPGRVTDLSPAANVINASYEPSLLNPALSTVLEPLFYSYICFSFVGLLGIFCLTLNLLIQYSKSKYESALPKWSHYYLDFYMKYLMVSNAFYIFGIIVSQIMILGLSIYFYFDGFWLV